MKTRLAIFGTGGQGREAASAAVRSGWSRDRLVFVIDFPSTPVNGIKVIGPDQMRDDDLLHLAVGKGSDRLALSARFGATQFATVIAGTACVDETSTLADGAFVGEFAFISAQVKVGRHFQGNVYSQISHDCIIGDFVTFGPRASCNGWVEVENSVTIGAGAIIRNGSPGNRLVIGEGATIGMGAVVTGSVPPGITVVGNPARALV